MRASTFLLLMSFSLGCGSPANEGFYGQLSFAERPPEALVAGVSHTLRFSREEPGPMAFTAVRLSCWPREACEATALPSVTGTAAFEVRVHPEVSGRVTLEPVIERDADGRRFADEFQLPVEALGEVFVATQPTSRQRVSTVAVQAGESFGLCVEASTASGRFLSLHPSQVSVAWPDGPVRLDEVRVEGPCRTFRASGHGQGVLVFAVLGRRLTVGVQVLSLDRIVQLGVVEVAREGSAWRTLGPARFPLQANSGAIPRYYLLEATFDDGFRNSIPPGCLSLDFGSIDVPDPAQSPHVFRLLLTRPSASLTWSPRCETLGVPFGGEVQR